MDAVNTLKEIFDRMYEPIDKDAIQRTHGQETKKGYDTTGYGYQFIVDRFNESLGLEWGFDWSIIDSREGAYKSGQPYFSITVKMDIWVKDQSRVRSCVGGHTAVNYADALKGAITNAFKKTAAFWGPGSAAFRGQLDPDNEPLPDSEENKGVELRKIDLEVLRGEVQKKRTKEHLDAYYKYIVGNYHIDDKSAIIAIFKERAEAIK